MPRVVVASPASPPFVRHTVMALEEARMLEFYATTYVDHPRSPFARALKSAVRAARPGLVKQLERRRFDRIPYERLRTKPMWELLRTFSSNVIRRPVLTDAIWEHSELGFDRWVARSLRETTADAVYTYEHAGLATLEAAKARGMYAFHEQPSQHHAFFTAVQTRELARYPEIANVSSALTGDAKAAVRNRRRDEELRIADCILCNSTFTKRTLVDAGIDPTRIEVTPYGFPESDPRPGAIDGPMVFINAGTQNLRKGIHLLYRAWRELSPSDQDAELWLIGRMTLPESLRQDLPGRVRIMDSIPHDELLSLYRRASVFVLPSLADGFGMVISEAMSRGLAVIATESCAAPDIMEHGRTGLIVPSGDVAALREQMRWCIDNRERVRDIGAAAADAASRWQWSDYREALARTVRRRIEGAAHV